jgi:hypothetical protein
MFFSVLALLMKLLAQVWELVVYSPLMELRALAGKGDKHTVDFPLLAGNRVYLLFFLLFF